MKRKVLWMLCALLLLGCAAKNGDSAQITEQEALVQTAAAEQPSVTEVEIPFSSGSTQISGSPAPIETSAQDPAVLPLIFYYYEQEGWPQAGTMFSFDFNRDGAEETIDYHLLEDDHACEIVIGDAVYRITEGCDLTQAILLDLDPKSEWVNLLVTVDMASADYVTLELHWENGTLACGRVLYADFAWRDGELISYERTDILGTTTGSRPYVGDALLPTTEWLTYSYIPSAEALANERDDLIENGRLLKVLHDLPCTVDGVETEIFAGTYLYPLRYKDDATQVEICTEDGTVAMLFGAWGSTDYTFTIDGLPQDAFFANIFYAD